MRHLQRLALHGRELFERRLEPSTPPLRLWIELTSRCDLACPACCQRLLPQDQRRHMDEDLLERLCAQVPGLGCQITLSHRGEPLSHPRFDHWIARFRQAGAMVRLRTSGVRLDEETVARLVEAGPALVELAIPTLHEYRYAQFRPGARLEETLAGAERLLAARAKVKGGKIKVTLSLSGRPAEGEEERARLKKLKGLGLDGVTVRAPRERGKAAPGEAGAKGRPSACAMPWHALVVLSDGRVSPCARDVMGELCLGQATEKTLWEIWRGAPAWRLRQRHSVRDLEGLALCRACDRPGQPTLLGLPRRHLKYLLRESIVRPLGP